MLRPAGAWPRTRQEQGGIKELYTSYAAPLAAIPVIAHLLGMTLIGTSFLGIRYRAPLSGALGYTIASYMLSLASAYFFALIIDVLAPRFGSQKGLVNAMKLSVYSSTPYWLAGVLFVVPTLSPLALLFSLYGFYLLYVGLPALMATPRERRVPYCLVLMAMSFMVSAATGFVAALLFPQGRMAII